MYKRIAFVFVPATKSIYVCWGHWRATRPYSSIASNESHRWRVGYYARGYLVYSNLVNIAPLILSPVFPSTAPASPLGIVRTELQPTSKCPDLYRATYLLIVQRFSSVSFMLILSISFIVLDDSKLTRTFFLIFSLLLTNLSFVRVIENGILKIISR